MPAKNISIVKNAKGDDLDAVEAVIEYLAHLPNHTTTPEPGRLKLLKPIPAASFGSPEIQPWRGAVQPADDAPKSPHANLPSPAQRAN
jgi:hypothetical protein